MRRDARSVRRLQADDLKRALWIAIAGALIGPSSALALRPIPDTLDAVHVWNDQLPDSMTDAQIRFVARHVDGTPKVSLQTARRLREVNPGFLVLHYRLAIGDGPVPFRIGEKWASDYGQLTGHKSWFWHQNGRRVYHRSTSAPTASARRCSTSLVRWITARDRTDYSIPDGVMIEGFAEGSPSSFYALGDGSSRVGCWVWCAGTGSSSRSPI